MKFKANSSLLTRMSNYVSKLVQNSSSPEETGKFVALKCGDGKLGMTVFREDVLANVTVDSSKLDPSVLDISEDGNYVADGARLLKVLGGNKNGTVEVEFESQEFDDKIEVDEDDELVAELAAASHFRSVGKLNIIRPGVRGSQRTWRKCFEPLELPRVAAKDSSLFIEVSNLSEGLQDVKIAISKTAGMLEQSHLKIASDGKLVNLSAYSSFLLVNSNVEPLTSSKFEAIAPFDLVQSIVSIADSEKPIKMMEAKGKPTGIVVCQDLEYGGEVVGQATYRIFSSVAKFPKFKDTIESLDLAYSCSVRADELKSVTSDLEDVAETAKTAIVFDPDEEVLAFTKNAADGGTSVSLPASDMTGGRLEVNASSRVLHSIASRLRSDGGEISFSGSNSLAKVSSGGMTVYFQPFSPEV